MTQALENRIEELEMRLSFQEDTIEVLNKALSDQQEQLLLLDRQLHLVGQKMKSMQPDAVAPMSQETPPPHY
ncbi:SlyX family protein [Algibacillus agarilyticus]|uniref:SlyX family protein n=1 Tax=Algibacillus agarilyticus TaxID=2234133 RepID=UPI000DD0E186|nr:SlyX family protein [Algibacillus agarilyticus]